MKQIIIDPVTRIEGHARIVLDADDSGKIQKGHLQVLEIRGFEKLLERMELMKLPLITGRICGVCPAAHHMASVVAIEDGLGVKPPKDAVLLRELMYMGHILHSHALSTFVLTGPDVIGGIAAAPGDRNVFTLLRLEPELVKMVLRLRSFGQKIVEIVGGRGVHPVTSVVGGISSRPKDEELASMAQWGRDSLDILAEVVPPFKAKLALLEDLRQPAEMQYLPAALSNGGSVAFWGAPCVVRNHDGSVERTFTNAQYTDNLVEHVKDDSYMKSVSLSGSPEKQMFVGPLARLTVNDRFGTPRATELLAEFKSTPRKSALDNIEARLVECVHAAERIAAIAGGELGKGPLLVEARPRAGRFIGMVEAPRGILIHDYTADDSGRVTQANLMVATQNNYDAIDQSITGLARHLSGGTPDDKLLNTMEFAMRCYDPCLACATHVAGRMPMEIVVRRSGQVVRSVSRGEDQA
jgi:F420-non-reducing hydrogenase large subunit